MTFFKDIIPNELQFTNGVKLDSNIFYPEEFLNDLFLSPPPLTQCILAAHLISKNVKDRGKLIPGSRTSSNITNVVKVNIEKIKKFIFEHHNLFNQDKLRIIVGITLDNENMPHYSIKLHNLQNSNRLLLLIKYCYEVWLTLEKTEQQPPKRTQNPSIEYLKTPYGNRFPIQFIDDISNRLSEQAKDYLICYIKHNLDTKFKECVPPDIFNYARLRNELCDQFLAIFTYWTEIIPDTSLINMCFDGNGETKIFKKYLLEMSPANRYKFEQFLHALYSVWENITNPCLKKGKKHTGKALDPKPLTQLPEVVLQSVKPEVVVNEQNEQLSTFQNNWITPRQLVIEELERLIHEVGRNSDVIKLQSVIELLHDLSD